MIGQLKPGRVLQALDVHRPEELSEVFLNAVSDVPEPRILISRPMVVSDKPETTKAYRLIHRTTIDELRLAGKNIVDTTSFAEIVDMITECNPVIFAGGGHVLNGAFLAIINSGLISDFYLPESFRKSPRMLWEYESARRARLHPLMYRVYPVDHNPLK
jgi:hypothetical protein